MKVFGFSTAFASVTVVLPDLVMKDALQKSMASALHALQALDCHSNRLISVVRVDPELDSFELVTKLLDDVHVHPF
jgi:hypothetical protein